MGNSDFIDFGNGISTVVYNGLPVFATPSVYFVSIEQKPIYLAVMMSKSQLQTIIDNKHLFDMSVVNAAYLLISFYDNWRVELSE